MHLLDNFHQIHQSFALSNFSTSSMLPTRTLVTKSINRLSYYLTTSANYPYLDKCHNCKLNKCFIRFLQENCEYISFPLTGSSLRTSATVITERQENAF